MRINACIASRGRSDALCAAVIQALAVAELSDTRIVVALDEDDPCASVVAEGLQTWSDRAIVSIAPREDSLGAKYNRAAAAYDADLYVLLADDMQIITPGWDRKFAEASQQIPDGIFCIYFGNTPWPSHMPAAYAVSRKLVDMMGFFMCPHFPFWWHDTTLYEIVEFIGRSVYVDIQISYEHNKNKTRGMRDVNHWAALFAALRSERWRIAERIIDSSENLDSPLRKTELRYRAYKLYEQLHAFDASNRDRDRGNVLELVQGYDAPNDERYQRIYQASQKLMAELA